MFCQLRQSPDIAHRHSISVSQKYSSAELCQIQFPVQKHHKHRRGTTYTTCLKCLSESGSARPPQVLFFIEICKNKILDNSILAKIQIWYVCRCSLHNMGTTPILQGEGGYRHVIERLKLGRVLLYPDYPLAARQIHATFHTFFLPHVGSRTHTN